MDPKHRALLKAKQHGLNVAAAFKARYTGPFEAQDKEGKVIPAMLSLDCVNPDTLEVKPLFDPDGKGAKVVDSTGKVLFECDNITAKAVKLALNKPKVTSRGKMIQEGVLDTKWEDLCDVLHYNDFNVVAVKAEVRCGKESKHAHVYIGEWDEGAKLPRIVFSAIQAYKTPNYDDAKKFCDDIVKYARECSANGDTSINRPIRIGNFTVIVEWTSVFVALITSNWRAVVLSDHIASVDRNKAASRPPRKKFRKNNEQKEETDTLEADPEDPQGDSPDPDDGGAEDMGDDAGDSAPAEG